MRRIITVVVAIAMVIVTVAARERVNVNAARGFAEVGGLSQDSCYCISGTSPLMVPLDAGSQDFVVSMVFAPADGVRDLCVKWGVDSLPLSFSKKQLADDTERYVVNAGRESITLSENIIGNGLSLFVARRGGDMEVKVGGRKMHRLCTVALDGGVDTLILSVKDELPLSLRRLDAVVEVSGKQSVEKSGLSNMQDILQAAEQSGDYLCGVYRIAGSTIDDTLLRLGDDYTLALVPGAARQDYRLLYVGGSRNSGEMGEVKAELHQRMPGLWDVVWWDASGRQMSRNVRAWFDEMTSDLLISFPVQASSLTLRKIKR